MICLVIAGIACGLFLIGSIYKEVSLLKAMTLGIISFFFSYVLASGLLFWTGWYSIGKACVFSLLILLAPIVYLVIKEKRIPTYTFSKKEWAIFLLMVSLILPATIEKFEFFGMGQDQGVYQTKALELINGNCNRIYDFKEYNMLETAEQRDGYRASVKQLAGYDLVDERKPTLKNVEGASEVAGVYHGIPTWPSILALFGEMFGISHMQDCQTLFLVLLILEFYFILENLKIKTIFEVPALLILGLSPQMLWVSKSALTEMFLAVIIACFVMLLGENKACIRYFSCIPILIFSFYHVTIYTMIPYFLLIYWGLYLINKEKKYLLSCNVSVVGYAVGFLFMIYISPTYTTNNYVRPLASLRFINDNTLLYVVAAAVFVALFITNILPYMVNSHRTARIRTFIYEKRRVLLIVSVLCLLCIFTIKCIKSAVTMDTIGNLTLISYAAATGLVLLPVGIVLILLVDKASLVGEKAYIVLATFIYVILLYSIFLRFQCAYYFYYGRYLVPYLFAVIMTACYLMNSFKNYYLWVLCFLGGISFAKPDKLVMLEPDDTRISWEVLEDVMTMTEADGAAIVVEDKYVRTLFLPLKSAGADIYNCWDDLTNEIDFLKQFYDKIYYVGQYDIDVDNYTILYRNEYEYSEYNMTDRQAISNYPLGLDKEEQCISLYRYNKDNLLYNICDEDFEGTDFGIIEKDSFAYSDKERTSVICYLCQDDYRVTLSQGPGIPLSELGITNYPIKVFVNDEYLTTLTINGYNNGRKLYFDIPKKMLAKKRNVISFESELWSPSDYGLNDSRQIGFSFATMEFRPIETQLSYDISSDDFNGTGFGSVEQAGFAWVNATESSITCYLDKEDYVVAIEQGPGIPLGDLGRSSLTMEVSINGNYLTTVSIDNNNNGKKLYFEIPKKMIENKINTLSFDCEMWSPADYGASDSRTLGFSFSSMEFRVMEPLLQYDICSENFPGTGFADVEQQLFAWTNNEKSVVTCYLEEKDYQVILKQGAGMPLEDLKLDGYAIEVWVNGNYVTSITIDNDNNGGELLFDIPRTAIRDGKNEIMFVSKLWCPTYYGADDTRQLGFAFSTMEFQEKNIK